MVGGIPGLEEREWEDGIIGVGCVVISIHDLRVQCIMTTFDPNTLAHDPNVMRDIVKRFNGTLALNCEIVQSGKCRLNPEVQVVRSDV